MHSWSVKDPVTDELPLPRSATVLDLLAHEAAWSEFSRIFAVLVKMDNETSAFDLLAKFAGTPLSELLELPIGPGMKPLAKEPRAQLGSVLERFSS